MNFTSTTSNYTITCTDLIFLLNSDGRSHVQRKQNSVENKAMQHMNKELNSESVIPRTQRSPPHSVKVLSGEAFVAALRSKLEIVQRAQRHNYQLMKLNLTEPPDDSSRLPPLSSKNQINHGQLVADLKRFQSEEDNQSILDQHVSRVWSDLTPHLSPGTVSPCPVVPNRRRTHDSVAVGDGKDFSDFNSIGSTKFFARFQPVNQCDIQNQCLSMRPHQND